MQQVLFSDQEEVSGILQGREVRGKCYSRRRIHRHLHRKEQLLHALMLSDLQNTKQLLQGLQAVRPCGTGFLELRPSILHLIQACCNYQS